MIVSATARARGLMLLATLACGCLFVASAALLFSELAMSRPSAAIAGWERGEPMVSHVYRRKLLARMGQAIAVNPMNARQRMELGRFFAWHSARHRAGSPRATFYGALAADRFAEAIIARPTWGFAWALLAEQWALGGKPQAQVIHALRRAVALSPQEPIVQLKSLWLGLGQWAALDAPLREQLTRSLQRLCAEREYFARAAGIVLHYQQVALLNSVLSQPWQHELLARVLRADEQ